MGCPISMLVDEPKPRVLTVLRMLPGCAACATNVVNLCKGRAPSAGAAHAVVSEVFGSPYAFPRDVCRWGVPLTSPGLTASGPEWGSERSGRNSGCRASPAFHTNEIVNPHRVDSLGDRNQIRSLD
jgi:hypothetical protein